MADLLPASLRVTDRVSVSHDHRYTTATGGMSPGVTGTLTGTGQIDPTWFTEAACLRGTQVHDLIERWLTGRLPTYSGALRGYLTAAHQFLQRHGLVAVVAVEQSLALPGLYGGTIDLVCLLASQHGRLVVVDWKSGASMPWHALQLVAYRLLVRRRWPRPSSVAGDLTAVVHPHLMAINQWRGVVCVDVYLRADGGHSCEWYTRTADLTRLERRWLALLTDHRRVA